DFEAPADQGADNVYDIVVHANDGTNDTTRNVAITVTNVDEIPPTITSPTTASTSEGTSADTVVYTVTATDSDSNGPLSFSLTGPDAALFGIDAGTGEVRFLAVPDFEAPADQGADNVYDIVVHANDGTNDTTRNVAITVTNVDEIPPTITSPTTASTSEGTSADTVVYTVTATDSDSNGPLSFSLTGPDAALFGIDAGTGEVRFLAVPDFEAPADQGADNVYDIVVHANDGTNDTTRNVAITVTNVDEIPPTITSPTTASTSEGTSADTVVYTVTATDSDSNGPLSFSLTGPDAALFGIDAGTGEVRFLAVPDFEAPADQGADNVYDIVVHANDGTNDTTRNVAITVTNVDEIPPTITSPTTASTSEGTSADTVVYTVTATDSDSNGPLSFSLTGPDAALFGIDAGTGEVRFLAVPDFEAPADQGADNVYDIVVHANDGTNDTTRNVAITVTNVDEIPPTITSPTTASTSEGTSADTVVYTVTATDSDSNGPLSFSLTGPDAALFGIDAGTGEVRFLAVPDFEAPADQGADNVYDVVVHANDGTNDTTRNVAVTVTNVDEIPPTITSPTTASTSEGTSADTVVYTVTATDSDSNGPLSFSLTGPDAALFGIDAGTGEVRFLAVPDFEAPADQGVDNVYDIVVHANDGTNDTTRNVAVT